MDRVLLPATAAADSDSDADAADDRRNRGWKLGVQTIRTPTLICPGDDAYQ